MSLFEFILVIVSLILAIGVTRLLEGFIVVVRERDARQVDWVPLAWGGHLFVLVAAHWWSLWDFRNVEWTFPAFFYLLLPPTLLYVAASLLVSGERVETQVIGAEWFERIRVPFLAVMAALILVVTFDGWLLGTEAFWNQLRWFQIVLFACAVTGVLTPHRGFQKLIAALALLVILLLAFVLRFLPGAFGPA